MILKLIVCVVLIASVTCKSVKDNNNRYIIVLKDEATEWEIEGVKREIEGYETKRREEMKMESISFLLPIVFANLSKDAVKKVSALPSVAYIEKDQLAHMYSITDNTSKWLTPRPEAATSRYNLDIINKLKQVCTDGTYNPTNDGEDADIYIMDTGINYGHIDFGGRAQFGGYDPYGLNGDGRDDQGHGSHCAGTAAGAQSGVAKKANLFSIKVLDSSGSGSYSVIEKGLDHVGAKHEENKNKPGFVASIASLSLGGGYSKSINDAVNKLVSKGVIVATASGNDGADACLSSPGSAGSNINVGAHDEPEDNDGLCSELLEYFSNWGKCVDVIAPGRNVLSVDIKDDKSYTTMSGTSMACPHVAGAAALIMKEETMRDGITRTPEEVKDLLMSRAQDDLDRSKQSERIRKESTAKRLYVPPPSDV